MINAVKTMFENMVMSRCNDYQIARMLWETEYKYETFEYVLNAVKNGNIHNLHACK